MIVTTVKIIGIALLIILALPGIAFAIHFLNFWVGNASGFPR